VGDEFVVDMFLDEKYGTFVFNTVGGQSKCPHEVNTNPIELPNLSLETAVGITPVDESMIFKVGLNNEGYGTSSFAFYHETGDNVDGLSIDADGAGDTWFLTGSQVGGSTSIVTLTIDAGPEGNLRYSPSLPPEPV